MDDLANLIRREVHRVLALEAKPRVGLVSAYDPDNHLVKVRLMPEDVETAWLPIGVQHIGNGFGIVVGPEVGDQVEVGYQENDPDSPRVLGRLFSDEEKPPKVESGEILIKRKDGTSVFFDKDGNLTIQGTTKTIIKAPNIELEGAVKVTGNITQTGSITSTGTHQATGGHI